MYSDPSTRPEFPHLKKAISDAIVNAHCSLHLHCDPVLDSGPVLGSIAVAVSVCVPTPTPSHPDSDNNSGTIGIFEEVR